ncbi:hypothetical protein LSAT2_005368 [Lamellibrachia satsuma]|nr:hypothetical protein LSAT2_005368 [Lamellibrachia satsuma]
MPPLVGARRGMAAIASRRHEDGLRRRSDSIERVCLVLSGQSRGVLLTFAADTAETRAKQGRGWRALG